MNKNNNTLGWGKIVHGGAEIWDDQPVFANDKVKLKDRCKLLFYPKKFLLYRFLEKAKKKNHPTLREPFRVLDVGCGTGAAIIDLKRMFGRKVEICGVEVVKLEVELAQEKIKQNAVWAQVSWYDGQHLPYSDNYFDAIYTSDVLGHVRDVAIWLHELNRVLRPGGALAMFSESALGRHAYVRRYFLARNLNIDPHAQFHISLFSKIKLKEMLADAGFEIKKMYNSFWLSFLVHPDEFYEKLQAQEKFFILKFINKILYKIKKKTHPYSTAAAEFYGLLEILVVGRFVEAQGYIILAKKKEQE